jgi:hypothetical protein
LSTANDVDTKRREVLPHPGCAQQLFKRLFRTCLVRSQELHNVDRYGRLAFIQRLSSPIHLVTVIWLPDGAMLYEVANTIQDLGDVVLRRKALLMELIVRSPA